MSELEYLYVIEFENGTVKIGRTEDKASRISDHRTTGASLGVPVVRTWISDAHEASTETERALLERLPSPAYGREWFRDVSFNEVVAFAEDVVQLTTDMELYHKRLVEAVRFVEGHTGRKINLRVALPLEVTHYFALNDASYVMSSTAFEHYLQRGGQLTRKNFLLALEQAGIVRRRFNDGARLYGIALKN
jgi:hypothetical protein